jgi:Niemann-Pick C1 protein
MITELTEEFEPSVDMDSAEFCQIVDNLDLGCVQKNLLDLWEYDVDRIGRLTVDEILKKLNRTKISPVTGHSVNYLPLLSGIQRNSSGHIVSAKAMTINFLANVNLSLVSSNKDFQLFGNSYWVR